MRVSLISSAFNSMTQRFYVELVDGGYDVAVELHAGNDSRLCEAISIFKPDLIIAPFLTKAIPEDIWTKHVCIIVHPGIEGDRGPSSLDWAIQERWGFWGVTLLQAAREMDAGPIWATRTFPMRLAPKSSIYRNEVIEAAVECLWEVMEKFHTPGFRPRPLDYSNPEVVGRECPSMKQADRGIDWETHSTTEVLARICAGDGVPGVLDQIGGMPVFLHNACVESQLTGQPGEILAFASTGAICRATIDGAIWIGHLKPKFEKSAGIKLPAAQVAGPLLPSTVPTIEAQADGVHATDEIRCEIFDRIGFLHFEFHNGAMSTSQCRLLLEAFKRLAESSAKIIVLMGGADHWSNGIHLNQIEASEDPSSESWRNINAMDDLVQEIITTTDRLVVAALGSGAGAGGAILPLAADFVVSREGVLLNPHYKNMGWLYGSEYWTYLLPRRVGWDCAIELSENGLPLSANRAKQLRLVDEVMNRDRAAFVEEVHEFAKSKLNLVPYLTAKKRLRRQADEQKKPLAAYRQHELRQMYKNFYSPNSPYHLARITFVRKQPACWSPLSARIMESVGLINSEDETQDSRLAAE